MRARFERVARAMHEYEPSKRFVVNRKPSIRRLSEECGLSHSTLNNYILAYEKGEEPKPDFKTAECFEQRTGYSWLWATTGEGPEKTGQLRLPMDDSGEPLLQGVINIVRRLTERVVESLRRQPDLAGYSEGAIRQSVTDALFFAPDIRTELDLGLAAQRLLRAQSGQRESAKFRAVPLLGTELVSTEPTDPRR